MIKYFFKKKMSSITVVKTTNPLLISSNTDVKNWNENQVVNYLQETVKGFKENHVKIFIDNEINGSALLLLTNDDLENHGIAFGTAIQITHEIKRLKNITELQLKKILCVFLFGRLRRSSEIIYTSKEPITMFKLKEIAKTCLDFPNGVEDEDIGFSIAAIKRDEDNIILHENNIKNKFEECTDSIKIIISTKQIAFSRWSFNMMTKTFGITANTFNELLTFDCIGFEEDEKNAEAIVDIISTQIKECYDGFGKTSGMKETQRWPFIERILLLSVIKSEHLYGIVTTADQWYFIRVDENNNGNDCLKYIVNISAESPLLLNVNIPKKDYDESLIICQIKKIVAHILWIFKTVRNEQMENNDVTSYPPHKKYKF